MIKRDWPGIGLHYDLTRVDDATMHNGEWVIQAYSTALMQEQFDTRSPRSLLRDLRNRHALTPESVGQCTCTLYADGEIVISNRHTLEPVLVLTVEV